MRLDLWKWLEFGWVGSWPDHTGPGIPGTERWDSVYKETREYGAEKLKSKILFFLSTSLKEPSVLVMALTNTSSILIIDSFVPKTLFRQGGCVCRRGGLCQGEMFSKSKDQNIYF